MALPEDTGIVAIHDAARPFVNTEVIRATLESARACGSGVICTPVVDTIKQLQPDGTVTRKALEGSFRVFQNGREMGNRFRLPAL